MNLYPLVTYEFGCFSGPVFIYSTGSIQFLCITDPEKAKEISLCTSLDLGKPSYLSTERGPLLGKGVLSSNGTYWVHQRKIIAPEFYLDKIKVMVNLMVESTTEMLKSWERKALSCGENVEISIDEDMRALSADIISRASFGSNYTEGERIFSKLRTLQNVMSSSKVGVPGLRHIPNAHNRKVWRLEKEIETEILNIVQARSGSKCERNLLKALLEAANILKENGDLPEDIDSNKFIVDNCKNIYFAGHETTAISASWCLLLLAAHPDWQVCAREEVIQICGDNIPDADMLRRMKVLTMIPIPVLHQHPELWGSDVKEFNPARFEGGTAKACKSPQAYMPFGVGTRTCVGQHFAMMELKIMLSLILSNFSLSLAPSYNHCPAFKFVVQPGYGVHLNIKHLFE
ncbi:oxygenase [Lithospermum erythrorhizon]|uniref:Oxygenase n=1 Tax=Lithospermum erythrorhizon TaxID=34254 RepID=A0AAV3RHV9_LITER